MPEADGLARKIWPVDALHFTFFTLLALVTVAHFGGVAHAGWWLGFDAAGVLLLILVERWSTSETPRRGALLRLLHGVLVVPLVFTQVGVVIQGVRPVDYARALERIDRWMFFGTNPLEALERFSHPVLTELMQWAYTSYLLLPIGIVVLLMWKGTATEIPRALFALLGVMYLSYVGYFLVPAAGPNIHNVLGPLKPVPIEVMSLYRFATDLPGVWLTEPLRSWMFDVELTKKDCFPSGHVAVAVVCWAIARRVDRRFAPVFALLGAGVTLSTVYLRYHYVVDVIAGIALAAFCLTWWLKLHDWMEERL